MSNNDLYCLKCKSNHHPAEDCVMYNPKTPTDVLKNQAGIDGNERVSIEQAVEDIVKMLPKKKIQRGSGDESENNIHSFRWVNGFNECKDEVHQIFKGGL